MTLRHYAFGNVGRDQSDVRSSKRLDIHALMGLQKALPDEQAAVILCEINEGDDNNEYEIIRDIFPGWKLYGRESREPILLSPDQPKAVSKVKWVNDTAVERWSPKRSVHVLHLADEPTSIVTCHPAAGANGQGDRPAHARGPLQTSWNKTIYKRNRVKRGIHLRGRNVVEMLDANAYNTYDLPLKKGEEVVLHDATDWGLVWAARGFEANFRKGAVVNFNIDSHDGLLMHGTFKRTK